MKVIKRMLSLIDKTDIIKDLIRSIQFYINYKILVNWININFFNNFKYIIILLIKK